MTEGRQPFTAEIKTLAKGPSTYDPLENSIHADVDEMRHCANGRNRSRRSVALRLGDGED
jgi:hypothetical protein